MSTKEKLVLDYIKDASCDNFEDIASKYYTITENEKEEIAIPSGKGEIVKWSHLETMSIYHVYIADLKERGYSFRVTDYHRCSVEFRQQSLVRSIEDDCVIILFSKEAKPDVLISFLLREENKITIPIEKVILDQNYFGF